MVYGSDQKSWLMACDHSPVPKAHELFTSPSVQVYNVHHKLLILIVREWSMVDHDCNYVISSYECIMI